MNRTLSWYLAGGACVVGVAVLLFPGQSSSLAFAIVGLLASAAVFHAVHVHRPPEPLFWRLLAASAGFGGIATAVLAISALSAIQIGYEITNVLYLPAYLTLVLSVFVLIRKLGPLRVAGLEAAIGALALSAFLWVLVIEPNAVEIGGLTGTFATVFPLCDVVVLMLILRVVFSPLSRLPTVRLLAAASALLVVSDVLYFSPIITNGLLSGRFITAGYGAAYVLFGAAALHPSMRLIPAPAPVADEVAPRRLLIVLGITPLTTPLAILFTDAVAGTPDAEPLAIIGAATVALVLLRIGRLLRHLDALRRRAEASEQRFHMVFDDAGHGMSIGADGMMTETNAALQRLLGYTGEELSRLHYTETTHPEDRALALEASDDVMSGSKPSHMFEKRLVRKDGTTVWVEVTLTRAHDGSFGISLIDDITARKELEEELRQSQKIEAVGKLAGGIAHDFNNVMTAVNGCAVLLLEEIHPSDPRRRRAEVIFESAARATDLTRQLLAFSRRQVLRLEPLDLAQLVVGIRQILEQLLPSNIELCCELEEDAVARADRPQLEQVLLNLALNARDAMGDGGKLRISVRALESVVELSVTDEGIGMDDDVRARIFEPFFTTKQAGTGLGLSMVDGVVGQSGGTVSVESAPGEGSSFTIRLPRVHEPAVKPQRARDDAHAATGRVLLADDEDLVRRVTTEMLRRTGYDVVAVSSGEEALEVLLGDNGFDALVTDVAMTGMDGPTLSRLARDRYPSLPVLFVSGYPAEILSGDRTITDCDEVLTKPFTPAELSERIEYVRRRAAAELVPG